MPADRAPDHATTALLTLGIGKEGLSVYLSEGGRPPAVGELDPVRLEQVAARLPALLVPPGGLLIPGDDAAAVRQEREAGALLAGLLLDATMHPVRDRLGHLAGRADAHGQPLLLLIDARAPSLRQLPWELLEALPPGTFPAAGCRVLRVTEGHAAHHPERATHLEVALWVPDADDPICRSVAKTLRGSLLELPRTRVIDVAGPGLPPVAPGVFRVVHVVCHGRERLGQVVLQVGTGRAMASDTAVRWLGPTLSHAGLVMLDVCEGGAGRVDPTDAPAWRLVKAGLPACIGPWCPLSADASSLFTQALYRSLAGGRTLIDAVQEGRRALGGMGLAHPSCRWWVPVLVVADEATASGEAPISVSRALEHWPVPDASAHRLLQQAAEMARAQGFLGIEHVAMALSRWETPSPILSLVQPQLEELGREVSAYGILAGAKLALSPRLRAIALELPTGFGIDDLLRAVVAVPWVAETLPAHLASQLTEEPGGPRRATLPLDMKSIARRASIRGMKELALEVLGGPEDGRILRLHIAGDYLGRWDPDRDVPLETRLYVGDVPYDRTVSRQHLRCIGALRIEVLAATRLIRDGNPSAPLSGIVRLQLEDVLLLGAATRLKVIDGR